ncbi:interferon-induced protein with tetratricopeptide repeats 2-like [Synchiropus splendidus]|uniref:interferon-induced protein with tetratricopeptide repeats 2-like n=1 Tax=Synchiropus splendidus TaxID=270530 RepID=UPI00237D3907|nr:interferon-induced protein with tetratricopeptide repeats 2-like [Synchiropus splendidus]
MTQSLLTCRCLPSSATESQTNMEARLKSLQCHFTWDELTNETKPGTVKETLENIGIDEGNYWLPHIYNLQGYLHHRLGSDKEALQFLHQATEDFHRRHGPEEGPWLMVNYGNLAWLLHLTGQQSESERYLSLSEDLMGGIQGELHPEVAAEKAWTLMALVSNHLKTVEELFLAAIEREPERVEWKTSLVLALVRAEKHESSLKEDTWQRLHRARQEDPENLYIAVKLLCHRAKQGEDVADEARNLAQEVLRSPASSYSGLKQMLRLYNNVLSPDEAVKLAEDALIEHPDEHYLKRCAALGYYLKITFNEGDPVPPFMMDRAIWLHQDVIALYPGTRLVKLIHLANIHACRDQRTADQMYWDLFAQFPDQAHQQMLCNHYGRLWNKRRDYPKSLYYHKKAAMMETQGFYRDNSIKYLETCAARYRKWASDIEEFLNHLPGVEP